MYGLTAARVCEILRDAGFTPRAYSGRGMYGKECVGFMPERYEHGDECDALYAVALIVASIYDDDDEREDVANLFSRIQQDSMGRDTILYWPRLAWEAAVPVVED